MESILSQWRRGNTTERNRREGSEPCMTCRYPLTLLQLAALQVFRPALLRDVTEECGMALASSQIIGLTRSIGFMCDS